MANKYASGALGTRNWSDDTGTWVTADGGSTPVAHPTSADVALFTSNSGNVTVDATSAAGTLNQSGFGGPLTIGSSKTLSLGANTHTLAGTLAGDGTGTLSVASGGTVNGTATSAKVVQLAVTNVTLNTGSNCEWYSVVALTGVVSITAALYTQDFQVAAVWAVGGAANFKIYVSRNFMYSTAGNAGTPEVVICPPASTTATISVITIGINVNINGAGTVNFNPGTYSWSNPSGKTFKYTSAGSITGMDSVFLNVIGVGILDTNGMKWNNIKFGNSGGTLTLASNLQVTTFDFTLNAGATISGADITADNFIIENKSTCTLQAGRTLNVTNLYINGVQGFSTSLVSGTASSNIYVNFTGTEDSSQIILATLTDVNFNSTRKMYNWFGTHTRVTNCTVVNNNTPSLTN